MLYEKTSAECQTHIEKMSKSIRGFEEDYKRAFKLGIGVATGGSLMFAGLALAFYTMGASLVVAGIAAAAAGGVTAGIWQFRKTQQEKKFKQSTETELKELQNKMSPMINLLEKMFLRTQEILRNPTIPEHKLNTIRDRFYHCFQDRTTLNLTGNVSETSAKIGEMLKLLDEILEDNKDEPAKPIKEEEFKKKAETFINEMREGINQLQNTMNEINQLKERISKSVNY